MKYMNSFLFFLNGGLIIMVSITLLEYCVKQAQKDVIATYHHLDGKTETKIIGRAHDPQNLLDILREEIDYILHPENYYYGPDYPNGFPNNYK